MVRDKMESDGDEELISLVKKNPVLYRMNHPNFMRTKLKDEIWNNIGHKFNCEGAVVRDRWTKLRDRHREALRRQNKKSSQNAEPSKPWIYQKQMEFLLPHMKNRSTKSNISSNSSAVLSTAVVKVEITDEESEENSIDKRCESIEEIANDAPPAAKEVRSTIQQFLEKSEERVRKREGLREQLMEMNSEKNKDAFYSFFNTMYMTAKRLPPAYQRKIRSEIFRIVTQSEEDYESEKAKKDANVQTTLAVPTDYLAQFDHHPQEIVVQNPPEVSIKSPPEDDSDSEMCNYST